MLGWVGDIESTTLENGTFRTVVFTGEHAQLTVMRLGPRGGHRPGGAPRDGQFIRIERGKARIEFGRAEGRIDATYDVENDWAIVIPAGVWHNVVNTGTEELKLYSIYPRPSTLPERSTGRKPRPQRPSGHTSADSAGCRAHITRPSRDGRVRAMPQAAKRFRDTARPVRQCWPSPTASRRAASCGPRHPGRRARDRRMEQPLAEASKEQFAEAATAFGVASKRPLRTLVTRLPRLCCYTGGSPGAAGSRAGLPAVWVP